MSHNCVSPSGASRPRGASLPRALGSALLVGSLLIAGTGPVGAVAPEATVAAVSAGQAQATATSSGVVAKKRKPKASVSATVAVAANGKVLLSVASNAKRIQVRYRNASNRKRTANVKVRAGLGTKMLPAGAKAVFVRAKATKKLARSAWIAASAAPVAQPVPPPAPTTPPPPPPPAPTPPPAPSTTLVSQLTDGTQGNLNSASPVISPDGTKVAFLSVASNLVPGDTNGTQDIFIKNLETGSVERISTAADGSQANGQSMNPAFSADGSKVVFASVASTLTPSDTNAQFDVFVKSLASGVISRVSTDAAGNQSNGGSAVPSFGPDGTTVVFYSYASNLVGGDTNATSDIFVKSLTTQAIQRVSTDSGGGQADGRSLDPVISPDGTKVAFYSFATNLVAGDTNAVGDVFVKSLTAPGDTQRVSTAVGGGQSNGFSNEASFSPDSAQVMFTSAAANLVANDTNANTDVFLKTLAFPGSVVRLSTASDGSQGTGLADGGRLSGDGTKVAFSSTSTNLVSGDTNARTDVFVKTLATGTVTRVSTDSDGGQANGDSSMPWLAADGSKVAFYSLATNLVSGDTNAKPDVFLKRLG